MRKQRSIPYPSRYTAKLIPYAFVYATRIVQSLYPTLPQSDPIQAFTLHPLWLYSPVCVGPLVPELPDPTGFLTQRGYHTPVVIVATVLNLTIPLVTFARLYSWTLALPYPTPPHP